MNRTLPAAILGLGLYTGHLGAAETAGTFKELDTRADTLTLTVGRQDRTYPLAATVKVLGLMKTPLKDGLYSKLFRRPGVYVSVKTERRDGQDVVVELRLIRRSQSPLARGDDDG